MTSMTEHLKRAANKTIIKLNKLSKITTTNSPTTTSVMPDYKKIVAATATAATLAAAVLYTKQSDIKKDIGQKFRDNKMYGEAALLSRQAILKHQIEHGLPGVVVGVAVDGEIAWLEAFGLSNVETMTPCSVSSKMRIASISKPITISLLAKLKESGSVDLDVPIQQYVTYFPSKVVNGNAVTITTRLLACHKAGIRHYKSVNGEEGDEVYIKDRFKNVADSVALFSKDDLLSEPGEKFAYTTHGYTLISAVIEGAAQTPFHKLLKRHLDTLGLTNTHLDEISPIVYKRTSYYRRNSEGQLVNAELTDNSYKWAGGGLVSDVSDLLKFANIMLYSYQQDGRGRAGFLDAATVRELWTPVPGTAKSWSQKAGYGLGWDVVPEEVSWVGQQLRKRFHVGHSGAAVGASSILLVYPLGRQNTSQDQPSGVVVAIITNMESVSLYKVANEIAEHFIHARDSQYHELKKLSAVSL